MRTRRKRTLARSASAAAVIAVSAGWLACTATPAPVGDADATPAVSVPPTSTGVPTTVPTTPPPSDARADAPSPLDAALPVDAALDGAAPEAGSDAAGDAAPVACGAASGRLCTLGEACGGDADCAGPNVCEARVCAVEPPVRTVAEIPALTHFDFEGTTLITTVSTNPTKVSACELPGCAASVEIPNITMATVADRYFPPAIAGGYVQYPVDASFGENFTLIAQRTIDGATAGASGTLRCQRGGITGPPSRPTLYDAHGGVGFSGLYKCITNGQASYTAFSYLTVGLPAAINTDRVGRGAASIHTNGDAVATLTPYPQTYDPFGQYPGTTFIAGTNFGAAAPFSNDRSLWPAEIVTTPKSVGGVNIASPTVLFRLASGALRIVRRSTPGYLVNLPHTVTTINADERYLYLGQSAGLSRCELSELAATSTCTLQAMTADPVDRPLYVTPTHVWYRSGDRIRRATK